MIGVAKADLFHTLAANSASNISHRVFLKKGKKIEYNFIHHKSPASAIKKKNTTSAGPEITYKHWVLALNLPILILSPQLTTPACLSVASATAGSDILLAILFIAWNS